MPNTRNVRIRGYFANPEDVLRFALEGLVELPESLRPTHYGEEELGRKTKDNEIANRRQFKQFVIKLRPGFYLYGSGCSFDVVARTHRPSEIVFWSPVKRFRPSLGKPIMDIFARYGAVYGFGADWDEYRERNGFFLRFIDNRTVEGFLGRDFRRYVPGLYWLNYFSDAYRDSMEIDPADLAQKLGGTVSTAPCGTILQLYDQPTDWRERNEDVCHVIDETDNLFSKRDVEFPTGITQKEYITTDASLFSRAWPW